MSCGDSILVFGAGQLGMAVLRGLSKHAAQTGISITVLLRSKTIYSDEPSKQREVSDINDLGVSFLAGDLVESSEDELSRLFRPFQTIIGCTGFVAGPNTQIKLARAVLKSGVKRYVPWQFGVDYDAIGRGCAQDLFDEQLDVRDLLRKQNQTEWVIISTGMFTSFLFESWFGVVDLAEDTVRALGNWDNAVTVTAPEDIGAITAKILLNQPRIKNQVIFTGSDSVTYARLADIMESVLCRKMHRVRSSVPMMEKDLAQDPDNAIKKYRVVFGRGKGVSWDLKRTFNQQKGIQVESIEQWARSHLK
ncbi:MAG: hypothetical protein M1837_007139 [Sclerophora amabilis]|nr:MAG: hypothetical protein M1837_007139 [Sclerophora amabilis]